jgi:hypothetical protein
MKFQSSQVIPFAVDEVFVLVRDRLQDLVPYMPNVVKIVTESREEAQQGQVVHVLNRWYGKAEIPKAVAKLIDPEKIAWLDTATWDSGPKSCRWEIKPMFFQDSVRCSGINFYRPEGNGGTRLEITGDLTVQTKGIPGVPRVLAGKISEQVEKFIVKLLTPNLDNLAKGVTLFLTDRK